MVLKDFIPPVVARLGARLRSSAYGWSGNYTSWADALRDSGGYDSQNIVEKVAGALFKVKSGEAVHERDGVLFDQVEYSWPLLSGLLWSAARNRGALRVMDFGGSLGSTYFQNRRFFAGLTTVSWSVVEQPEFVRAGKKRFEDDRLKFYENMEACIREEHPDVFIFSCVLQYLEKPFDTIKKALALHPAVIIIDNMPFTKGAQRLMVQRVPPEIYPASYPCWILNRKDFLDAFQPGYALLEPFQSPLAIRIDGATVPYEGFIFTSTSQI